MAGRSPARFLAPIALIAVAIALYSVVKDSSSPSGGKPGATTERATATPSAKAAKKSGTKKRKSYTVKAGDTPSGIAEKHDISLQKLMELNPELDPATMAPGQKIRLSE